MMGSLPFNINGPLPFCSAHYHRPLSALPATIFNQGLQENEDTRLVKRRSSGQAFRVLAISNVAECQPCYDFLLNASEEKDGLCVIFLCYKIGSREVPPGKRSSKNEAIMVDPVEAKRLAAKQMQEIQAKERLIRQRRIEAINGAWAMIGLTAGLVIEGNTGNSILAQLAGYWRAFFSFFVP